MRLRTAWRSVAAVAAAGVVAGLLVTAQSEQAHASGSLTQVTGFGSNPGNLQMYSYLPTGLPSGAPLVVALHGCTQSATDYYDDSGWPKYADMWDFALVFPQQQTANNAENCFDWFTASDDSRSQGEAESIYQMVGYAESTYHVDPHRIFVTGLSAGGGMTADLLADYPDVFAGGSVDSGLPAQCATSQLQAYSCMDSNQNLTPQQWGNLVRNADSGYTGPMPKVAIWQGTSDTTVSPVNLTELMDQWTNAWGIGQTASATHALPGGTTETEYDANGGPVVETYSISGMNHGLAVNPGSATDQCGNTGTYYLNYICSSYYTALFWGINTTTPPPTTTTSTTSITPTTAPPPSTPCYTESNYQHTVDGHAYQSLGYAYAVGSNQNMGLDNVAVSTSLQETRPGYYVIVSACP